MNDQPKVGEYWYCNINSLIQLVPIIGIGKKYNDKTCYIIKSYTTYGVFREYDTKYIDSFIAKWQPNLFWRLLGYK